MQLAPRRRWRRSCGRTTACCRRPGGHGPTPAADCPGQPIPATTEPPHAGDHPIDGFALHAHATELGRVGGVSVRLDRPGLALLLGVNGALVLLLAHLARPELPAARAVAVALAASALLVVSAGLHELAHLVMARRAGQPVGGLVFGHFGACVLVDQGDAAERDLGATALYVVAGPAVSLGLWLGLAALADAARAASSTLALTLGIASALNLALLALNLCPVEPLDGGRLLRCLTLAWRRRAAAAGGV
jgi:Zn-dependent protease